MPQRSWLSDYFTITYISLTAENNMATSNISGLEKQTLSILVQGNTQGTKDVDINPFQWGCEELRTKVQFTISLHSLWPHEGLSLNGPFESISPSFPSHGLWPGRLSTSLGNNLKACESDLSSQWVVDVELQLRSWRFHQEKWKEERRPRHMSFLVFKLFHVVLSKQQQSSFSCSLLSEEFGRISE